MRALVLAIAFAFMSASVLAQGGYGPPPPQPQPVPYGVKGTIVGLDGDVLTVKSAAGETVTIQLTDKTGISAHARRTLADIKSGDFVGSAAVPGPDGKLVAQEVHIFPESMRGTYEGHHDMPGGDPGRTMTNAAVSGVAAGTSDTTLTLTYPDGQQEIMVGPDVPVFAIVPGDRTWLTAGMAVSLFGQKAPDGTITAFGVFVEHDGQKPLM